MASGSTKRFLRRARNSLLSQDQVTAVDVQLENDIRPGLYIYALDDGEADRQLVFTAAKRFCPAVFTSPRAATTPETVLAPGCAARSLTDVLSVESAELSELVWAWYWLCAPFTNVLHPA